MDPMTLIAGLQAGGQMIDQGFGMYKDIENLKINRNAQRETAKSQRLARLLKLLETGQGMSDNLAGNQRLFSMRNPGV